MYIFPFSQYLLGISIEYLGNILIPHPPALAPTNLSSEATGTTGPKWNTPDLTALKNGQWGEVKIILVD